MGQPLLDTSGLPLLDSHGYPLFISGPLYFPTFIGLAWPVQRHPTFDNLVQRGYGGKKTVIPRRSDAIYEYTVDISVLRTYSPFDFQACIGFLNSLLAQFGMFYFDDKNDNAVTDELFGVGDGSTQNFQLYRMYGYAYDFVYGLKGPAPIIKKNGIVLIAGADYTISTTGLVHFLVAPAVDAVVSWTGGFYWLCQFNEDKFALSEIFTQMFELKQLTFETNLL